MSMLQRTSVQDVVTIGRRTADRDQVSEVQGHYPCDQRWGEGYRPETDTGWRAGQKRDELLRWCQAIAGWILQGDQKGKDQKPLSF